MTEIQQAGTDREQGADEASEKMAPVDSSGGTATGEQTGPRSGRDWRAVWWFGRPSDRTALLIWFFWEVACYIYLVLAAPGRTEDPILDRFNRYDSYNFEDIAKYGYDGRPEDQDSPRLVAFFPGLPLLLRVLHLVIPDLRLALVLVSFVASAVVAVALSRLSESYREGSGHWTVLAFFCSPFAVFLLAGYTEALFLALAIPAWLLARQGRWETAAVCAAFASSIRISGLFLALGLVVQFLVSRDGLRTTGGWRKAPWLLLPGVPVLAYMIYLWHRTGDLMAWKAAEAQYWGRYPEAPWNVFINTWHRSFDEPALTTSYREEILSAIVLVVLIIARLIRRNWADFAYLAPQAVALLAMSSFYMSVGRASLLWWPLYISVGVVGSRRPWAFMAYIAVAAPVMAINVGNFTTGAWVG
ncbi:mannosyltransferase family protein [Microbispora sp. CA-135349]|uniref:mannosyltransferase family protein n=1 Tax=Microbispora sp. CA-135349 TaxID=3239953 RepID=UPI003D931922